MKDQQGTLKRTRNGSVAVRLVAHDEGASGQPAYFEVFDLAEDLEEDEIVTVHYGEKRGFRCQVLDHTNVCAVIAPLAAADDRPPPPGFQAKGYMPIDTKNPDAEERKNPSEPKAPPQQEEYPGPQTASTGEQTKPGDATPKLPKR